VILPILLALRGLRHLLKLQDDRPNIAGRALFRTHDVQGIGYDQLGKKASSDELTLRILITFLLSGLSIRTHQIWLRLLLPLPRYHFGKAGESAGEARLFRSLELCELHLIHCW
jgi:hypothetical protein